MPRKKTSKTKKVVKKKAKEAKSPAQPSVETLPLEQKIGHSLVKAGIFLVFSAFFIFGVVFLPVIKEEFLYFVSSKDTENVEIVSNLDENVFLPQEDKIVPVNETFSIIVPKIKANAAVIENVDPYNSADYQVKLTQGVAHAKGTSVPGKSGNTFLFAHSSDNFYNANRYNSVFYLLNKMELEDAFFLVKEGKLYEYSTIEKAIVDPERVEYLENASKQPQATLMTCWPPGTTLHRLILVGKLVNVSEL